MSCTPDNELMAETDACFIVRDANGLRLLRG